ncbi:hypothetical protein SUNI508_03385 [Seiridium unicorne]|uniref:Uncharacterized protein n=1 Tax=Seiridium unicorne TaxID=138068 RepID=A0ABR2VCD6_9PEZI
MDDTGACPDGDSSEAPHPADLPGVVEITETGDLVLDCVFENSKATLKSARKNTARPVGPSVAAAPRAKTRVGFRVDLAVLRRQSKYFDRLLGDLRFKEAKTIEATFEALSLKNMTPALAHVRDIPWLRIVDDDEATRLAHREEAFGDMLRVLHGREVANETPTLDFVTTLAVLADRFDCAAPVSKVMASGLKLKWPITQRKVATGEDPRMSRTLENILRQKILVSWLLNQSARFHASTRELILNGSGKWCQFPDQDDGREEATWWYLQDGIEQELQFRRECILNVIASVPRHFFSLYTSRTRQCKLGYDSSAACDSYQLGEMIKFLTTKNLFFLVDFSPSSLDLIADTSLLQVDTVIAILRQCPGYQIDKHHTNCGLRTRMLPILDFIKTLLSTNSVPLSRLPWKNDRKKTAWLPREGEEDEVEDPSTKHFKFTRAMSSDQRLRFEHTMGAEKFARDVFTASTWNWSVED